MLKKLRIWLLEKLADDSPESKRHLAFKKASLEKTPHNLVAMLNDEIKALRSDNAQHRGYYAAWAMSKRLGIVCEVIQSDLTPNYPKSSLAVLLNFMGLHSTILKHFDDYECCISGVFYGAVVQLRQLAPRLPMGIEEWVELIYVCTMDNQTGVFDGMIPYFQDILGKKGLELLEKKIVSSNKPKHKGVAKKALELIAECKDMQQALNEAHQVQ